MDAATTRSNRKMEAYRHQVGGHSRLMKPQDSSKIFKPHTESEQKFYEKLTSLGPTSTESGPLHTLKKFVPKYYGVKEVQVQTTTTTLLHHPPPLPSSPLTLQLGGIGAQSSPPTPPVIRSDLTSGFTPPPVFLLRSLEHLDDETRLSPHVLGHHSLTSKYTADSFPKDQGDDRISEARSFKVGEILEVPLIENEKCIVTCARFEKTEVHQARPEGQGERRLHATSVNGYALDDEILIRNTTSSSSSSSSHLKYIILEDLVYMFKKPCVMDIKMGMRQRKIGASVEKEKRQVDKSLKTTSHAVGFRLCGCQVSWSYLYFELQYSSGCNQRKLEDPSDRGTSLNLYGL